MTNWNPIFNLVMKVKHDYIATYGELEGNFKEWLEVLNKTEYNDVFDYLQFTQNNDLLLIRYGIAQMQRGMWDNENSIFRECRSVVIDLEHDELVLTPFKKFFNLNEVDENKLEVVTDKFKTVKCLEIANKLDGSMQNARYYKGEIIMSGSKSLDKNLSWRLAAGYEMLNDNYELMFKENEGITFTFEHISIRDAHVVAYNKSDEGMYLIGMRNVHTGEQYSYTEVIEMANKYNVKVVNLENKSLDQLLDEMKSSPSYLKEGWVINLDGHYIKLKCDDYVNMHGILDKISSINVIISSVCEGTIDDILSKIPELHKVRVINIVKLLENYLHETESVIHSHYVNAPKDSIKNYMIWVTENVPENLQTYVKRKYLNRPYHLLRKGKEGYKKANELGIDFGDLIEPLNGVSV